MLEAPGRVLPRAFSLCLAPRGELAFLIDPVGPGTTSARARSSAATRSPCSARSGTASASTCRRPLLVGGGIGIAPLPYLSEALERPPAVLGFRSALHADAAALVPNAEVVIDPVLVTEVMPTDRDVLACGPEPMLEAVRALVPARAARLGGADGVRLRRLLRLRRPGRRRRCSRLCVEGPVLCMLLNASGCLDALAAPEVARLLDAFVTKTVTPEPREGNPPVRIAETDFGMLNSIGLANPGRERFLGRDAACFAHARACRSGCPSAGSRRAEYAETCAAAR